MVNPVLQGKCHIGARNHNRGGILSTIKQSYKRYPVSGRILFRTESVQAVGELVGIARGGALIRSEAVPSPGSEVTACFIVRDYPGAFEARGKVVRILTNAWAIEFLGEPPWLTEMLQWLERTYGPVKVE